MPHDASQNKAFVSVMMNNLNQKHHHTTTVTCVCLVYNTQTQSLSDPGWQSLQASNTWRQLDVMPSTITPELMFECIHPWKLPNKAWWQAMLTPSFFCHGHLNCKQHLEIKIWPARHEHLARHVSCTQIQKLSTSALLWTPNFFHPQKAPTFLPQRYILQK